MLLEAVYEHPNGSISKIFNNLFPKGKKILQEVLWLKVEGLSSNYKQPYEKGLNFGNLRDKPAAQ